MRFPTTRTESPDLTGINVTPLIDVMLCLLVIFLISAPVLAQRVPLDLPQRCADCPPPQPMTPVSVSIGPSGEVSVAGNPVVASSLEATLLGQVAVAEGQGIVLAIAPEAPFDALAKVLGSAHNVGVSKIAFATP